MVKKKKGRAEKIKTSNEVTLGLCMIVKDEEDNMRECLLPLKGIVDEIVVVDTGSKDRTKVIAEQIGAKIFDFPWKNDFSLARNESIRRSTTDYLIWLDADDRVKEEDALKLLELKKRLSPSKDEAYFFIVHNISPVDGNTKFYQIRLFPRISGVQFEGSIHELLSFSLKRLGIKTKYEDITIKHIGYENRESCFRKIVRNLKILKCELKKEPENLILHFHIARTLAGFQKYREAIKHLRKITENPFIKQKEKEFYLQASIYEGKYYIDLHEYQNALIIFEELSKDFNDRFLVHFFRGLCFFYLKDIDRAMNAIKISINLPMEVGIQPFSSEQILFHQHYIFGKCLLEKGDSKGAREMFLKSINGYREEYKSIEELGVLALKEGDFDEAIKYFEDLIDRGVENDRVYTNFGLALKKKGFIDRSIKAFERALEMNSNRIEAILNLGHIFFEKKTYSKAEDLFEKALRINPHLIDARLALSVIFFKTYRMEELVSQCDLILKELSLPRNYVIESFEDIAALYENIGDYLIREKRKNLSIMAYNVSFLILPSKDLLRKISRISNSLIGSKGLLDGLYGAVLFNKQIPAEF